MQNRYIVYQCEGHALTVGLEFARSWSRGMAQKIADRLNDDSIARGRSERYAVRYE